MENKLFPELNFANKLLVPALSRILCGLPFTCLQFFLFFWKKKRTRGWKYIAAHYSSSWECSRTLLSLRVSVQFRWPWPLPSTPPSLVLSFSSSSSSLHQQQLVVILRYSLSETHSLTPETWLTLVAMWYQRTIYPTARLTSDILLAAFRMADSSLTLLVLCIWGSVFLECLLGQNCLASISLLTNTKV